MSQDFLKDPVLRPIKNSKLTSARYVRKQNRLLRALVRYHHRRVERLTIKIRKLEQAKSRREEIALLERSISGRQTLQDNPFQFNGKDYLQTHGTAMGTKMVVAFANIFMAKIQKLK